MNDDKEVLEVLAKERVKVTLVFTDSSELTIYPTYPNGQPYEMDVNGRGEVAKAKRQILCSFWERRS
jgi:hypothetical protein